MEVTLLVDAQETASFLSEFGLSFLIREGDALFLFDTGAGNALGPNLARLEIAPASLEKVILSHGHYDHTGGLPFLSPKEIWCVPGIAGGHFSRHDTGEIHPIAMPEASQALLKPELVHWVRDFQRISPTLFLTGPIPRISGEDCGGDFYCDAQCRTKDFIPEEQALLSKDGVLVSGCCHAGIINTILHCRKMHPEIAVRKIIGGLHLLHAGESRLQKTAEFFREAGIEELHLLHCTGDAAIAHLQQALPKCVIRKPELGATVSL